LQAPGLALAVQFIARWRYADEDIRCKRKSEYEKGMTHILLENFLEGAREAGAEVETVFLQKKR